MLDLAPINVDPQVLEACQPLEEAPPSRASSVESDTLEPET